MGEVIVITSGKGGVGKTSTTANLGIALSRLGKRVILIDADIGLRNLDIALGFENSIVYDWVDYVSGSCGLDDAILKDNHNEGLFFLPAAQTKEKDSVTVEQMKSLCKTLEEKFDFVLVDCPAGIDYGFRIAFAAADKALIITTPEISSVRNAERVAGILEKLGIKDYSAIINRIRPDLVKNGTMLSVDEVLELLSFDLGGIIPEDPFMYMLSNCNTVVLEKENSFAAKGYMNIAERLCGNYVPLMDVDEKKFLKSYKKLYGRKKP